MIVNNNNSNRIVGVNERKFRIENIMMRKRQRKTGSSFGSDGRRMGGVGVGAVGHSIGSGCTGTGTGSMVATKAKNRLFRPGQRLAVQRAPLLNGLTCNNNNNSSGSGLWKPFQRPIQKRRAHLKAADVALKSSSLGMKRRFNGMQKIMDRAGKPLHFLLPKRNQDHNGDTASSSGESSDDDDDEDKENDRPFEPLMVWKSPHQGGDAKGLPTRLYVPVSIQLLVITSCELLSYALISRNSVYTLFLAS